MDWGMVKELFCPFVEQAFKMKEGGWYLVYCYLDEKTERLVASSKTNRFLTNNNLTVKIHEEVDLIVSHPSTLGMNVIINNSHLGLIYKDDIFKDLSIGDKIKGYVKKIREGNKIDVTLQKMGYRNIEPSAKELLKLISIHNGKLSITDKKSPLIIAEISGNHCGKKSIFLKHIKYAAKCGADLIKIQTYEPVDITLRNNNYKIAGKTGTSLIAVSYTHLTLPTILLV